MSKKYKLSKSTIYQHAKLDNWQTMRTNATNAARTRTIQKTAEAAADNATIAERLKKKLLLRLERIEEKYPMDATEVQIYDKGKRVTFKLRDLTAAYKDLTDAMNLTEDAANELLLSLEKLERGEGW